VGWCGIAGILAYQHVGHAEPVLVHAKAPAFERHYVSPQQLVAAGAMRHQPVAANATLRELQGQRPLVLVFLKKDCPCSVV
jgi:hypothetical protein